jgi:hypothetical protein
LSAISFSIFCRQFFFAFRRRRRRDYAAAISMPPPPPDAFSATHFFVIAAAGFSRYRFSAVSRRQTFRRLHATTPAAGYFAASLRDIYFRRQSATLCRFHAAIIFAIAATRCRRLPFCATFSMPG